MDSNQFEWIDDSQKAILIGFIEYFVMVRMKVTLLVDCAASRQTRQKCDLFLVFRLLRAALGVVLFAIPLVLSLKGAFLMGVIGVRMAFVIFGVAFFAPFHAWVQQLIPSTCRYAVISLGYALGTQALGSPTAALALWCFQKTGMVSSVVWYWMFLGLLSSGVIAPALQKKQVQILKLS